MSRITYAAFTGYLAIPNTNDATKVDLLTSEIERLQNLFFVELFGYGFQKEMLANPTETRFEKILDGVEFTDVDGNLNDWNGINDSLTKYVYVYFIDDNLNGLTGVGYAAGNSENSDKVQAISKPVDVFNSMVDEIKVLTKFLIANESDYDDDGLIFNEFKKMNKFGF